MSDILDHDLREQLAAALLGCGGLGGADGAQRRSGDIENIDDGLQTPKAEPELGHQEGYIRGLMQYADEGDGPTIDDIDADSDTDTSDIDDGRPKQPNAHPSLQRQHAPLTEQALSPLPVGTGLASPKPEMSCRISHFPFSHPCDVPELMPDHEDSLSVAPSSSTSGPATPAVTAEVARPPRHAASPDLEFGPISTHAPGRDLELHHRMRTTSVKSGQSGSEGLGVIQEEEDDEVNSDGVSLLTPTEISLSNSNDDAGSYTERNGRKEFLSAERHPHRLSVSSLGSGGASRGSSEWRPSNASVARKSVSIFSRIRIGGRLPAEEEPIERKTLTPLELSMPPPRPGQPGLVMSPPQSPPLASPAHTEANSVARFFLHMPWSGDSQPTKQGAVFGVDLKESIRVAPMKIRISHKGMSTSSRIFPLSVHKCCEFIRRAGGTDGNIFSSPGNAHNVASLKAIFSQPPTYGEDFQFEGSEYTVHDAASLILVFLEELPKPLIPPSVVKSWILLARQEGAIEPPCPRVETGLDFWTEALNRLPTANRNLTKHLLTLFAEVLLAATGGISEADARQFASGVSRAMFHQDADTGVTTGSADSRIRDQQRKSTKKNVHPILALAFLIKKRGEYAISLGKASGNGSKRETKMFLPSTREILEWKGGAQ
ncbi:hypothetical protein VTK56DRAFT_8101 [Thermocarpiscus australiensis]